MFHNLIFPYRNRILEIVLVFQFKTLFQEDGNGRLPLTKNNIIIENKIYKYSLNKCKYIHIYIYKCTYALNIYTNIYLNIYN